MMKYHLSKLVLRFAFAGFSLLLSEKGKAQSSQTLSSQLKILEGKWIQESWMFSFEKNGVAKEFFDGKLSETYRFKITPANSPCATEMGTDVKDTTNTFLQLTNQKNGIRSCYLINLISYTDLNIRASGLGMGSAFTRPKKGKNM